jgi:cysteine-rich repeat protein
MIKLIPAVGVAILLLGPAVASAQADCGNGMVDMGEDCDGGVCCAADCTFVGAGTVCRPRAETCNGGACLCDAVEVCDGMSADCPADDLEPSGTVCRPVAKDLLNCPTPHPTPDPFANCPDAGCDEAEVCDGMDPACPEDEFKPDTHLCRPSQGPCDLDDFCSGEHAFCLPDRKSKAECRPTVGLCDPPENCDGIDNDCPADVIKPSGTVCRPVAGACDLEETCTGGPDCPGDLFKGAGIGCRPIAGDCDLAEECTGTGAQCPADGFKAAGIECRPSVDPMCDFAESCTGGPQCPPDAFEPNGTSCDDGLGCTIEDMCVNAVCTGNSMTCGDGVVQPGCNEECDDGNPTSGDGCSATCQAEPGLGCPFAPLAGCRLPFVPAKAQIKIRDQERVGGLKFIWRWRRGAATDVAELGDPLATTHYQLCVYDQDTLLTGATAPAAGICGVTNPKPCWKRRGGRGFRYKDVWQSILPSGISKLILKAGRDGKAEVQLHATGGLFEFPSNGGLGLPHLAAIQQPLRIQVQNSLGLCFEAVFSAPPIRQDPERFEDLAD